MKVIQSERTFTYGIAFAPAFVVKDPELTAVHGLIQDVDVEEKRFMDAVDKETAELEKISQQNQIFEALKDMVQDPGLMDEVSKRIREEKKNAEWALEETISEFTALFEQMEDEYLRARAADVCDVGRRLLLRLKGLEGRCLSGMDYKVIVIARDLSPADTAVMDMRYVAGFVTQEGGITSHIAIMAKSLGIPALVGVSGIMDQVSDGIVIAMDAHKGEIVIEPDEPTLEAYQRALEEQKKTEELFRKTVADKACTKDGTKVNLYANVGNLADIDAALAQGAEGIGLFRTEFLYLENDHFPTEEEQFAVYAESARRLNEKELIIRTLDIGGDKTLSYYRFEKEDNPFLGCRAIRLCLQKPEIFKTQLRALLRASAFGNLRIMYPMIADLEELKEANKLLDQCRRELRKEGKPFNERVPVGMMIETPAAVMLADRFARYADFFSIGTNDLTQYMLAADRGNRNLSHLYDPLNPAVLHAIQKVISAAHTQGIPVGMCGEFAANEKAVPILLGWGLDEFSVSANMVPKLKLQLKELDRREAEKVSQTVLECKSKQDVLNLLKG